MTRLTSSFYQRKDVVNQARELIGKVVCTFINGRYTSGVITETEAYAGITDRASHAYGNRKTSRTEPMFANGGIAYVYLCYGIHSLFNVVTAGDGEPHAILLRAIEPLEGIEIMEERRKMKRGSKHFSGGPGTLSIALDITLKQNRSDLEGNEIWIEDRHIVVSPDEMLVTPRIGVGYAGEDAKLLYRFVWKKVLPAKFRNA